MNEGTQCRKSLAGIGGFMPTIFDIPDMWRLNATRAGGKFNLLFGWWLTPLFVLFCIPFTLLCLVEWALMTDAQRAKHRAEWGG